MSAHCVQNQIENDVITFLWHSGDICSQTVPRLITAEFWLVCGLVLAAVLSHCAVWSYTYSLLYYIWLALTLVLLPVVCCVCSAVSALVAHRYQTCMMSLWLMWLRARRHTLRCGFSYTHMQWHSGGHVNRKTLTNLHVFVWEFITQNPYIRAAGISRLID